MGAFRAIVVGLFGLRRKQLQRAIRQLTDWTPETTVAILAGLGIDPQARAESLSPATLAALAQALVDRDWGAG